MSTRIQHSSMPYRPGLGGGTSIWIDDVGSNSLDHVNKVLASIGNGSGAIKAVYAAAKRAAQRGKTEAGRFAAEEYTINKGTFMSRCKIKTSVAGGSGGATSISISFAGTVIPLIEFNTKYSKGGMLSTQVKRTGGSAILEHAFAAPLYGATQVHEHAYVTRGPVETLYGPSTGHMMQNEIVTEKMEKVISETFDQRIDHEMSRILNGW